MVKDSSAKRSRVLLGARLVPRPFVIFMLTVGVLSALVSVPGCSQNSESSTDITNAGAVSINNGAEAAQRSQTPEQSPFTEGCRVLTPSELVRLQELKPHTPYKVLVPTCIPQGYELDFSSVYWRPPSASQEDTSEPDYLKKPTYDYFFTNKNQKLRFAGNLIGDIGPTSEENRELRGHQAVVFYSRGNDLAYTAPNKPPLEASNFYYVLWDEERDIAPHSRHSDYFLYGILSWDKMKWIVNGMVPIDEVVPESNGVCNIRGYDWSILLGTKPNNDHIEKVLYSDIDGDGEEEALVQRRLEGSGGYFSVYVFDCSENGLLKAKEFLDMRRGEVILGNMPGTFTIKAGIFESNDRNCCPSNFVLTTFAWFGEQNAFEQISNQVVPNPEDQTP